MNYMGMMINRIYVFEYLHILLNDFIACKSYPGASAGAWGDPRDVKKLGFMHRGSKAAQTTDGFGE